MCCHRSVLPVILSLGVRNKSFLKTVPCAMVHSPSDHGCLSSKGICADVLLMFVNDVIDILV